METVHKDGQVRELAIAIHRALIIIDDWLCKWFDLSRSGWPKDEG